ncbi:hypothetical protein EX30DRAFT_110938 [Ascodesmis nigricans]|uniref:Uncharacterized protein n=1 Tax=Ascodesmis nigricans TaxID=341454 RepID=A0A4S2MQ47_9PEZI|nr:hypothetical protein EX30DRAFT_110938 [Ascodesmis nigricans]
MNQYFGLLFLLINMISCKSKELSPIASQHRYTDNKTYRFNAIVSGFQSTDSSYLSSPITPCYDGLR